jgi:hypothetical protein
MQQAQAAAKKRVRSCWLACPGRGKWNLGRGAGMTYFYGTSDGQSVDAAGDVSVQEPPRNPPAQASQATKVAPGWLLAPV